MSISINIGFFYTIKFHKTFYNIECITFPIKINELIKKVGLEHNLSNDQYYFKSSAEMKDLFSDIPHAIKNINDLLLKITPFDLNNEVQLPKFQIPKEFSNNSKNGSGENI